jgi:hypothetical protein
MPIIRLAGGGRLTQLFPGEEGGSNDVTSSGNGIGACTNPANYYCQPEERSMDSAARFSTHAVPLSPMLALYDYWGEDNANSEVTQGTDIEVIYFTPRSWRVAQFFGDLTVGGAGQTIAVNQVTETDLAQAMAHSKLKTLGQIMETDLAQAITRVKIRAVGQVFETDLSQVMTSRKTKTIGQISETDLAQGMTSRKTKTIGQVTEADLAQVMTSRKTKTIGQVTEADLAQNVIVGGAGTAVTDWITRMRKRRMR